MKQVAKDRAPHYRDRAGVFFRTMKEVAARPEHADSLVLLAIHSAIAYADMVLVACTGARGAEDHSEAITDWEGMGDAIIGIHGPIDSYDDSLIGTTGAAISHGCIRLHDADLAQLAAVAAGSPFDVVA